MTRVTNQYCLLEEMISVEDAKELIISVVAAMTERIKMEGKGVHSPFANRTNIYRCEDGRPICYCCLRVGHVAKYCWDRRYSCHHLSAADPPHHETFAPVAAADIRSLRKDLDCLLLDLDRIVAETEQIRAPFLPQPLEETTEYVQNGQDAVLQNREYDMITAPIDVSFKGTSRRPSDCTCGERRGYCANRGGDAQSGTITLLDIT